MNAQEIKEYFTPRTQQEQSVFDEQVKRKANTVAFFGLSAGAFALSPVIGIVLGIGAVGAGVYCTCKVLENYVLATENLKLYHAMKKETSIHTENYKELGQIADTINDKESTIGNIIKNIRKLRVIEEGQKLRM